MHSHLKHAIVSIAAVVSLSIFADTYTWKGGSGAFWTPGNWKLTSTGQDATELPAASDHIVIPLPEDIVTNSITVTGTALNVASLTVGDSSGNPGYVWLTFANGTTTNEVAGNVSLTSSHVVLFQQSVSSSVSTLAAVDYKLNLHAGGDITIGSGAIVSANARGFYNLMGPCAGPNANGSGQCGGAYGGIGGVGSGATAANKNKLYASYGSIRNPTDPGSAGKGTRGGGVIYLCAGGTLTVAGSVQAIGGSTGAGGSIILKGNAIAGSGSVQAKGGSDTNNAGGGGRIAIYTKEERAYSSLTLTVTAQGGIVSKTTCGTIYFESGLDAPGRGELVFDGKSQTKLDQYTYFTSNITDAEEPFGKITVKSGARVNISTDTTMTATKSLYVAGPFTATYGSRKYSVLPILTTATSVGEVRLAPEAGTTFTFEGTLTNVHSFVCNAPGAAVNFVNGSVIRVNASGNVELTGAKDSLLTLNTTTESGVWRLQVGDQSAVDVRYVNVSRANSDSYKTIGAVDSPHDEYTEAHNWVFSESARPGDPLTWTGAEDRSWLNPMNWLDKNGDNRVPEVTDAVRIPAGCERYPLLTAIDDVTVNSLTNEAGASISLSGVNLTVTNCFLSAGTISRSKTEKLVFAGDGDATLDFANGEYDDLHITKSGGTVTLPNGLSAKRLKVIASSATMFVMPATQKLKTDVLDIEGTDEDFITLVSSTPGTAWKLQVDDVMRVRGVTVSDSNASDGRTIAVGDFGTDGGGNSNWDFTSGSAVEWVGGTDSNWTTAANWLPEGVPGETAVVAIRPKTAAVSVTFAPTDLIVPIGGLMIGDSDYTVTLQCNKALDVAGGVDVGAKATLVLNSVATNNIVGCGMVVRPGATITHTGPLYASTQSYGVNLLVKDDMAIESGATINVNGKGFYSGYGPGKGSGSGSNTVNPSHGGIGARNTQASCYGSIFRPRTLGSPYPTQLNTTGCGGGQVAIAVGGTLKIDGSINAGGGSSGGGTGGSIWLTSGTLLGSGTIAANCISGAQGGAGGRVAIYQTVATSLGFSGSITVNSVGSSGAGTRYYQYANKEEGGGTIYFAPGADKATLFPMADDGPAKSAYSKATINLSSGTLYVRADTKVKDINITGGTINLQGHTIRVLSTTHKDGKGWYATYANCVTEGGGKIIWVKGLAVTVR